MRVQVVVDDGRRSEGPVERAAQGVGGCDLVDRGQPRRKHRVAQVAELVDAAADREADAIDEDLILDVGAQLGAILGAGRDGDVEVVAPDVARRR